MGPDFELDVALVRAAREGLGPDIALAVDAGTMWKRSAKEALRRAHAFAARPSPCPCSLIPAHGTDSRRSSALRYVRPFLRLDFSSVSASSRRKRKCREVQA